LFAEIAFKKALQINSNYMEAALNLAVLYNNLGLGKKSKAIYEHLKKYGAAGRGAMDPMLMSKIANMHAEIGDLYHSVGEYESAIDSYGRAVDLCPKYLDVQTKLASCYRESGDPKKAVKIFKKFQRQAGNYAPFWIAWGVTSYALGKNKDAFKSWQKALKIEPRNKTAQAYSRLVQQTES
jgi:tetratricopeptide (TPR) repeat protein